jgi:ubiquinone/menaquinone biosynthesis C-methylase UbiE
VIEQFLEDQIQALIALAQLQSPTDNPNDAPHKHHPLTLAEAQTYFRRFSLDLKDTFITLHSEGLVEPGGKSWTLTSSGITAANELRLLRPPIYYWYKDFYTAIQNSMAFDRYATMVFGVNMGQHGFSDLSQIDLMLSLVNPMKKYHVLDLGCGNGRMAEYVSDKIGCTVTGIDYVPEAIESALNRIKVKKGRLQFILMNMENLAFPDGTFDLIYSVDTIFFGRNMNETISGLKRVLKETGKMAVFSGDYARDQFLTATSNNSLTVESHDLTDKHIEHMLLKHRVAMELKDAFAAEGNTFIWENLIAESFESLNSISKIDFNPKARYLDILKIVM